MKLRHLAAFAALLAAAVIMAVTSPARAQSDELPRTLRETGFFDAPGRLPFTPQYPLWSDGADKQRVIALPDGAAIDASDPDAWDFPRGTRLWKTFSHGGRAIETRYIERRPDGGWRYAAYVWSADGREAELAPARGSVLALREAPGSRYVVPSRGDCLACHAGATVPVLGFAALQLSGPGPTTLRALVERGVVRGLPPQAASPRIAAASATERAALGYLHGNCAQCHHANAGRVPVRLNLMQRVADAQTSAADVLRSMLDAPSRYQPGDSRDARVVVPGDAAASVLLQRMRARDGRRQMPPLGTDHPDTEALALLTRWIQQQPPSRQEH
jgi:Planctomycete cytochrome C